MYSRRFREANSSSWTRRAIAPTSALRRRRSPRSGRLSEMPDQGASDPAIDFRDLFETAPCGYLLTDCDGQLTRANRTFADWVGEAPESLRGRRFSDLLSVAGKIFYETHFAPTLRMRGRLNEIALELVGGDRGKLAVVV